METAEHSSSLASGHIVIGSRQCSEIQPLGYALSACGYSFVVASSRGELDEQLDARLPELILLDRSVFCKGFVGYLRLLRTAYSHHTLPIIVMSRTCPETDRIRWFEAGADDVVVKPISQVELLARINAIFRRIKAKQSKNIICVGDTELDRDLMCVRRKGHTLRLGPKDYEILEFLLDAPGQVRTRGEILTAVWGQDPTVDVRTIDVHIRTLRKSLQGAWRSNPIKTVRGAGYRFDPA